MPSRFCTPELELAAVTNDGWAIEYVTNQTLELCLAAVRSAPSCLSEINMEYRTLEVCVTVLRTHPDLMGEVPPELRMEVQRAVEADTQPQPEPVPVQ